MGFSGGDKGRNNRNQKRGNAREKLGPGAVDQDGKEGRRLGGGAAISVVLMDWTVFFSVATGSPVARGHFQSVALAKRRRANTAHMLFGCSSVWSTKLLGPGLSGRPAR